jgi:hypothetical protein
MAMKTRLATAFVLLSGCGVGSSSSDDGDGSGAGNGAGSYADHPIVCDAPMCNADEGLFGLSVTMPPVEMRRVDAAEMRADLAGRISDRADEMVFIAHWLQGTPTGDSALDAALRAHPLSAGGRRRLTSVLDRDFGGWRELSRVPLTDHREAESAPRFESAWQGLETSGCGEMRLQMALGSVTVQERDDNFSDDRVYCVVRATDAQGDLEFVRTDVSPPLGPGQSHAFEDGVFFGRGGARDPGETLDVEYDCWEMDDASEYERFEEILDQVMDIADALGVRGALVEYEAVARALILLGKLFDGNDYLFHTAERFTRQDLWVLAATQPQRSFTARGTHFGGDWSWSFSVLANACAVGESTAPGSFGGGWDGGGGSGTGDDPAPATCDGCWVGGTCKGGNANDACGTGGADCTSCSGLDSCRGGQCVFDSSRTVDVVAVSAQVPGSDPDGFYWDVGTDTAPEVIMTLSSGGRSGSTNLIEGYDIWWDTTVLRDVRVADLMDSMEVELVDDDARFDEFIDGCHGAATRADISAGEVTWGCGSSQVTIGFR